MGVSDFYDFGEEFEDGDFRGRYALAGVPMMIQVNESFPRITQSMIQDYLGADGVARIGGNMTYQINVEGMGLPVPEACFAFGLNRLDIVE